MAYELIREIEQPSIGQTIKRLKLHLPKADFLQILIVLLIPVILLSILLLHTSEPFMGIFIGLTLYYILHKEEIKNTPNSEAKGEVKVADIPEV